MKMFTMKYIPIYNGIQLNLYNRMLLSSKRNFSQIMTENSSFYYYKIILFCKVSLGLFVE